MRKAILAAVLMLLCALPALAAPQTDSLSKAEVDMMLDTGLTTLGEYAQALSARYFTWNYLGAATGETEFTLDVPGGAVTLNVSEASAYQDGAGGLVGADQIANDVLALPARLTGCVWENRALTRVYAPGGLKIGDNADALKAAFPQAEISDISEYDIGFEQRARLRYATPDDWKEYYLVDCYLADGRIALIRYSHWTDPE